MYRYGGKVTSSLSKKTSYLVVGEEAGESKLAKVSINITVFCTCVSSCMAHNIFMYVHETIRG